MGDSITKGLLLKNRKDLSILKNIGIAIGLTLLCLVNCYLPFLLFFVLGKIKPEESTERSARKNGDISLAVISVVCAFAAIISFYYGPWKHSINLGEYILFSSWEILVIQVFPIGMTIHKLYKGKKDKKRLLAKKQIYVYLLAFVPLLLNNLLVTYERRARIFEKKTTVQEILMAVFTAALVEELFFRGFFYKLLKRILKKAVWAILVSSVVFSLWHIGLLVSLAGEWSWSVCINLIEIVFVGVICAELYDVSGNILIPILFHACNDNAFLNVIELFKYFVFR